MGSTASGGPAARVEVEGRWGRRADQMPVVIGSYVFVTQNVGIAERFYITSRLRRAARRSSKQGGRGMAPTDVVIDLGCKIVRSSPFVGHL